MAHLRDLSKTEHTVLYYGPKTQEEVVAEVNRYHQVPEKLIAADKASLFKIRETGESKVLLAPYAAAQVYMAAISNRGEKFDPNIYPVATLYNEYFGGGIIRSYSRNCVKPGDWLIRHLPVWVSLPVWTSLIFILLLSLLRMIRWEMFDCIR